MARPLTRICFLLLGILGLAPVGARAHDIPSDVKVQTFLEPRGQRLRLLVRLPIAAMNDIDWPSEGMRLDLSRVEAVFPAAVREWVAGRISIYEDDRLLGAPRIAAVRVSLPADLSFVSYETALAHVTGPPLPPDTDVVSAQALMDVLLEYAIESDQGRFAIEPRFGLVGLRSLTTLRFLPPGGGERAFQFHDDPGTVRLDPRWFHAAGLFAVEGFFHILDGVDHLLFLFCLVIPLRRVRALVPVVTAFTVAHSITLVASAYDMAPGALWFPPLVETLIAASIVYMALENIVSPQLGRRWVIAFGFGLVHGFGFSFALRDTMQFAGQHLLTSLLSFNVGVELGQLLVLIVMVPVLELLFRLGLQERIGTIVLSAIVAHTGWHWMVDRGQALLQYQFVWPSLDAAFFALLLRWAMVAVALAAAAWLGQVLLGQRAGRRRPL